MISISTTTANANGNVILQELADSDTRTRPARVRRVKTLDGGVTLSHAGVVDGDRTLVISCRPSAADMAKIQTIFENEILVIIAFGGDVYTGVIADMKQKKTTMLTVFIKEKIS